MGKLWTRREERNELLLGDVCLQLVKRQEINQQMIVKEFWFNSKQLHEWIRGKRFYRFDNTLHQKLCKMMFVKLQTYNECNKNESQFIVFILAISFSKSIRVSFPVHTASFAF